MSEYKSQGVMALSVCTVASEWLSGRGRRGVSALKIQGKKEVRAHVRSPDRCGKQRIQASKCNGVHRTAVDERIEDLPHFGRKGKRAPRAT